MQPGKPQEALQAHVLAISQDEEAFGGVIASLRAAGVAAERERTPSSALDRLRRSEHQVVLVDADSFPQESGDFVATICKSYPDLIVLVTAASPGTGQLIQFIRAGVYDCLLKPVDEKRLSTTIRFLCQRRVYTGTHAQTVERLRKKAARLDRNQAELSREIIRANEELLKLNKALKKNVFQLTVLYQMGRDVSENENWSDALDRFLMAFVNYTQAEGAALLLFSEEGRVLGARSNFQIGSDTLEDVHATLLSGWKDNPRGGEIHSFEGYGEQVFNSCLGRTTPWRITVIPLKHRNRALGFLVVEKEYKSNLAFQADYHLLNTIQTIFAGEVANAGYISELRQLGRFNQKVLDNISSGVITTDLEGHVRFFNETASELCPILIQSRKVHLVHFDEVFKSHAFGQDFYRRIISSDKDTHVLKVRCLGDNNKDFPARLSITKMHDDNLNGTVLVAIFEDLTEQARLEEEIRRNDRLRVLGQFSASVAHEIRNPLTGIATSAEVLAGKLGDDERKLKYIRVILSEINRLDEIIRSLLNYARPVKPHISPCGLAEIAGRVVQLVADHARKKKVEIEIVDRLEIKRCEADGSQLAQVLLNLVRNSIQASREGDRVRILLSNEAAGNRAESLARIDVVDSGEGVPPEVRHNLFEPFVTTKTHGSGLGLAISQQIIEEHNGTITCEFLPRGTRFSIHLPIGMNYHSVEKRPTQRGN